MLAQAHYSLGKEAHAILLHHCNNLRVRLETLTQASNPTRFYHGFQHTFLFVLKGEVFLKHGQEDMLLKMHQGTLLSKLNTTIATVLTPQVEICVITFFREPNTVSESDFKKVSSGTVEALPERLGVTSWPLWRGKSGTVSINLYPAHYKESTYYHKSTEQFLLPLSGEPLEISTNMQTAKKLSESGLFIEKQTPKAFYNISDNSVAVLSIYTPHPEKGRVMLLSKATNQ
ncbi:hypothetical protein MSP8887_01990 [Marinomonas spartinae]|uniref:hypothetical protein n=1 Tax=Marinomonas spartinae TaxID=1792290 RepID=UPI0008090D32|nr:hypothetical protein [Marinomonas spartinae]SBS33694.1 hypothetical protein MSP8887_01990 [Marinomonas spartinae]